MIFTLRKKFILINAVSVLLVFTGIFLFQAVSGVMQMNRILDTLTDAIASNNGVFPAFQPSGRSPLSDWLAYEDVITEETRFSTRFFTVRLDENGQVTEMNMNAVSAISKEEVADYAARAAAEGASAAGCPTTATRLSRVRQAPCLCLSTAICSRI